MVEARSSANMDTVSIPSYLISIDVNFNRGLAFVSNPGHAFDSNPGHAFNFDHVPALIFDPNPVLKFGSGPVYDFDAGPPRFQSRFRYR
ncbi:hypothetical protein EVAR_23069_1 [Eumeta japonica]|uniref:Uncharacterized protein n=1 Tax=Eumeta variegata TaxID=151549 RepID=A0A4C1VPE9_EUMVA|nr:hypothetical protein EVAR_23069_1 [Eumeta japonica]